MAWKRPGQAWLAIPTHRPGGRLAPREQLRGHAPASSSLLLFPELGVCAGEGLGVLGAGDSSRPWQGAGGSHGAAHKGRRRG